MLHWLSLNESLAWWLVASSTVTFVASLVSVPWLVIRLPPDHFSLQRSRNQGPAVMHPLVRLIWLSLRNLDGVALVLAVLLVLVLPVPDLMTIVVGFMMMYFTWKRCLVGLEHILTWLIYVSN